MENNDETVEMSIGVTLNRQKLDLRPGAHVSLNGLIHRIVQVLDFDTVVGVEVESGRSRSLRIGELSPVTDASLELQAVASYDMEDIADTDWKIAEQRYAAIKPLLSDPNCGRTIISERAAEVGVDTATLYRWLRRYQSLGVVSALIPRKRGWKAGGLRISKDAEDLIQKVLQDTYLTNQRSSPQKVILEVMRRCQIGHIEPPHPNTVRARISALGEKQRLFGRGFKEKAKNKFMPAAGRFPNADYPLAVVQIDHTPADIILVDDIYRKPIGRPWITVAIDVFSRMIVGYYLSFDPPSETSVAMCVAHAVLPKDEWLALHKVDARWDVWGIMDKIHTDNGADFRSDNFTQSCLMHNIDLEFRPVKQPRYGGHIERMLGTLLREIHDLPGTTFSSIKDREGYDSEKHAAMTKSEFETWLVTLICKVYHQRLHTGIGMTPARKWEIGMFGNAETSGRGLPPRPTDRLALLLDFLPNFKRTIQTYGVAIDGLRYYADVLRTWINASDPNDHSKKREFIFRRDPRDISAVWFYDPDLKQYFKVPFANQALPSMSIWEYNQASDAARKEGMKPAISMRFNTGYPKNLLQAA
ncbi:transposase [Undibacterium sp. KW1]|uniref:Mu transposase C-terminal domain-containing protein n=1 Tax=Undibacterium sp. KW1 TaxID=2058624 RepID=UPI001331E5AA|nr:Mu transposase C-terminal domain-containing protein [Undibacterium sp. KW1]BBB58332.1 transposase [Undibacterium sp. KW1]